LKEGAGNENKPPAKYLLDAAPYAWAEVKSSSAKAQMLLGYLARPLKKNEKDLHESDLNDQLPGFSGE
jgi:hypothetical protein